MKSAVIDLINPEYNDLPLDFNVSQFSDSAKVRSSLTIKGGVYEFAISQSCSRIAAISQKFQESSSTLFVVFLRDNRLRKIKSFDSVSSVMFHSENEDLLFVTSANIIYRFNIDHDVELMLCSHSTTLVGMYVNTLNGGLMSWGQHELVLWDKHCMQPSTRLVISNASSIIWCNCSRKISCIILGLKCGIVSLWEPLNHTKQNEINLPDLTKAPVICFSLSKDETTLFGLNQNRCIVLYCLVDCRVKTVLQMSSTYANATKVCSFFTKHKSNGNNSSIILSSNTRISSIDITAATTMKTLTSKNHDIVHIGLSIDSTVIGVVYSNGSLKIYDTHAFHAQNKHSRLHDNNSKNRNNKTNYVNNKIRELLCTEKWLQILQEYKKYPAKFRGIIWASLLGVPKNKVIFKALKKKGIQNDANNLLKDFKTSDTDMINNMQCILSCILFWAPSLSSMPTLPLFISPFVSVFQHKTLPAFEVTATVLFNWLLPFVFIDSNVIECHKGLEVIESHLNSYDTQLMTHLELLGTDATHCFSSLLKTGFAQIYKGQSLYVLWDHLLSNEPSYVCAVIMAFVLCIRTNIIACNTKHDIEALFEQETWLPPSTVVSKAYSLHPLPFAKFGHQRLMESLAFVDPLPKGALLQFSAFAKMGETQKTMEKKLLHLEKDIKFIDLMD